MKHWARRNLPPSLEWSPRRVFGTVAWDNSWEHWPDKGGKRQYFSACSPAVKSVVSGNTSLSLTWFWKFTALSGMRNGKKAAEQAGGRLGFPHVFLTQE